MYVISPKIKCLQVHIRKNSYILSIYNYNILQTRIRILAFYNNLTHRYKFYFFPSKSKVSNSRGIQAWI